MSTPGSINPKGSPTKANFQVTINASDEQVREKLHKRLEEHAKIIKKMPGRPVLSQHVKRVNQMLDDMPAFWKMSPKDAFSSLKGYASKATPDEKTAVGKIQVGVRSINDARQADGKKVQVAFPSVIYWLDHFANGSQAKQENASQSDEKAANSEEEFIERFPTLHMSIAMSAMTSEERKKTRTWRNSLDAPMQPIKLSPGSPAKATPEEKKEWRKSYDSKLVGPHIERVHTEKNPQFAVFSLYEQKAVSEGKDTSDFDGVFKSKVLAPFKTLKDMPIEELREVLKSMCNRLRFETLMSDPHNLLKKGRDTLNGDTLQLMPVVLRMVIRTALESVEKGTRIKLPSDQKAEDYDFPVTAGARYLESADFAQDYLQLQAALNLKAPKISNLVPMEELKNTLSSPDKKRKGLEKQASGKDEDDRSPRTEAGSPYKAKSRKPKKTETTTTTTTATTTTTTVSFSGTTGSPVKPTSSPKGVVRLYSASEADDMCSELKPTFETVMGQLNSLYEKYGPHLASGTMKLLVKLKDLYEKTSKKELGLDEMLPAAIAGAHLSDLEQAALKTVGDELRGKAQRMGRSPSALATAEFIVKAANGLVADYEKVKG